MCVYKTIVFKAYIYLFIQFYTNPVRGGNGEDYFKISDTLKFSWLFHTVDVEPAACSDSANLLICINKCFP